MCDLRNLPMISRTLNVTATDGQHFSDVTPVTLNFKMAANNKNKWLLNGNSGLNFKCRETDVAARLTNLMAKSERNNVILNEEVLRMPSRFGSNVYTPELQSVPRQIRVNETAKQGTLLIKVRTDLFKIIHFILNLRGILAIFRAF
jgi:hypothetical protein